MGTIHDPRFCSCCETPVAPAPLIPWNRPGLTEIDYRIGTFASFRQALLEAIADEPALAALGTRESDDFAITVLELFAAMGDVLTFYNERIANELFLRTSRERDSVLRLVRLIGYQMNPGLAATAHLAFTLDAGAETKIRDGLKVMSVPGQDEKPQIFETIEAITAHAEINTNPVFAPPVAFNAFHKGNSSGPVVARPEILGPGDRLALFGLDAIEEKKVDALTVSNSGERLEFSPAMQRDGLWDEVTRAAKLEGRLRFFGHNAPDKQNIYLPGTVGSPWPKWENRTVVSNFGANETVYPLDARYEEMKAGVHLLVDCGEGEEPRLRTAVVTDAEDKPASILTSHADTVLQDTVTHVHLRQTIRGRPNVVEHLDNRHIVLGRSGTGAALNMEVLQNRWHYLDRPHLASSISGVQRASDNRRDVFVRSPEGNLLQRSLGSGHVWIEHDRAQSPDGLISGGVITSEPRAVVLANGQFHVFARGRNGDLVTANVTSGTEQILGTLEGELTSAPFPLSTDGVTMDVFARGADRALWWLHFDGVSWGEWESLGGVLATEPAALGWASGRIEVAALDDAGALIYIRKKPAEWTDWINLGGEAQAEPAIIRGGVNRTLIFTRGQDNQLWKIRRIVGNWSPWASLDGNLSSAPSAIRRAGVIYVYARGEDGSLVRRRRTGSGWEAWEPLGIGLRSIANRRATRVFQISAEDVEFRNYDYPGKLKKGRVALRLTDEQIANPGAGLKQLKKGRSLIFKSGGLQHLATISAVLPLSTEPGAAADHWTVDFTPVLPASFDETVMLGNVALASHGETQMDQRLGNGDASKAFQKFKLPRAPLTYLQGTQSMAGQAELEVRINGELWNEVPSLYNRTARERIFTARQNDAGETILTFGDGVQGSRIPTGPMNVMATFRKGLGLEGRVRADQLSIALERPVGLRSVTNPFAADGGADPETRDDARDAAPATVRTFGRAVSLQDFEWIASTSGLVARSYVTWVWHDLERAVHLTVAGAEGGLLSSTTLDTLYAALNSARDPNRQLFLANFNRVPVVVRAKVLRDPAFEADDVKDAARAAVEALFAFESVPLGRAVHASQVYAALQSARGVTAVDLDVFHLKGYEDLTPVELEVRSVTAEPLQSHIRIFPARPTPDDPAQIDRYAKQAFTGPTPPVVLPAEQAFIENLEEDLVITMVETL